MGGLLLIQHLLASFYENCQSGFGTLENKNSFFFKNVYIKLSEVIKLMTYLVFKETAKNTGDMGMVSQCTSAIFNYQVIGAGAVVEFFGSNHPSPDISNEEHWISIATIPSDIPDTEPFRQHAWDKLRYVVTAGNDVEIYVSSGVSG